MIEAVREADLPQPQIVCLRRERLARVLGVSVADAEVERILRALGLGVEAITDGWRVTAPTRRFDIAIEEDLIEEIARIHGYNAIPTTLPGGATRVVSPSETQLDEATVRRQLVARDFLEAINYAFVDGELLAKWQATDGGVPLANPLSAELSTMRTMLLPGLVAALGRNVARQQPRVRLFEIGKVFASRAGEAPLETRRLAAVICGNAHSENWQTGTGWEVRFEDVRGDLDSLAAASAANLEYRPSDPAWAHPGQSADVYRDGVRIGWIGQLHPRLQQALEISHRVMAFEIDLAPLQLRPLPRATSLSRYPSVRRDLAFVVPEAVSWAALSGTVKRAAGQSLRDLRLFDRYVGKGVETGCKSLAMGLILQEESRTLTDRDIDQVVAQVIAALRGEHGAEIRS